VSPTPSWGDVATWVTAVATVGLLIGAIFTAVYAKKAYDNLREQLGQDKNQFQLRQAEGSLTSVLVLTRRLRRYAEELVAQRNTFRRWGETAFLSEDDALLTGAALLTAGYPQFEEKLVDLAHQTDSFDRIRKFRNNFLVGAGLPIPVDDDGANPWASWVKTESEKRDFEIAEGEGRQWLSIIATRCSKLEAELLKAFEDLRK
jgi:hypothetical protein